MLLARGRPEVDWDGEPVLGSIWGEEEIRAAEQAIRASMDYTRGFAYICPEIDGFEREVASYVGAASALSINGAGTGLDMAVRCLDLEPGDEVICPSINFRSAPMAILDRGGRWVPCEVSEETLQADPEDIERRITPRTRALLPVHMNGGPAEIDAYAEIAARHAHPRHGPLKVIYDGARSLGARYRGRPIGGDGWMTVWSFHTKKNITTLGEGGALTTNDGVLLDRLKRIRIFGGDSEWGSNYKLSKVQAAVGSVQLAKLDGFLAARRRLASRRDELLRGREEISLPKTVEGGDHTYYLYTLLVAADWAGEKRDRVLRILRERYQVRTVIANPPCHTTHAYLRRHTAQTRLPRSEAIGARLFCLPIHPAMSDADNEYLCAALCQTLDDVRKGLT